ncbi:MAG: 30S ribosomal protein S20 [Firmicutes bacterium]|nr:30S ribosomal protein S20 [Bacillota bacterium]MBQ2763942.1 30S ribosomal protein S20 [Bacillota bacterium]MBQ4093248.1 30S ribosomal protein S20 [Bacillota bacterium]MBR5329062.1 30S ribosomal protein S20 [Bacillota bacterium]
MPNIKSASKRVKVSEIRRMRNMAAKSRLKTATRKFKEAVEAGNKEAAQPALKELLALLDKAAGKNLIHKNAANRKKSKMQKAFNKMA